MKDGTAVIQGSENMYLPLDHSLGTTRLDKMASPSTTETGSFVGRTHNVCTTSSRLGPEDDLTLEIQRSETRALEPSGFPHPGKALRIVEEAAPTLFLVVPPLQTVFGMPGHG